MAIGNYFIHWANIIVFNLTILINYIKKAIIRYLHNIM